MHSFLSFFSHLFREEFLNSLLCCLSDLLHSFHRGNYWEGEGIFKVSINFNGILRSLVERKNLNASCRENSISSDNIVMCILFIPCGVPLQVNGSCVKGLKAGSALQWDEKEACGWSLN